MRVTWRGTADWFGKFEDEPAVLDIKTGSRNAAAHTRQLDLYGKEVKHRIVVYLKPDTFEFFRHEYDSDAQARVVATCALAWPKYRKKFLNIPKKDGITMFSEENHTYSVDGCAIPGVSALLELAGVTKPFKESEYCSHEQYKKLADIGTAVHAWVEHFEKGGDMGTCPPFFLDYVIQWQAFKGQTGFVPGHSEVLTGGSVELPGEINWQL